MIKKQTKASDMPKINLERRYKTKSGDKVRIYAIDGSDPYVVHGAVLTKTGWEAESWTAKGEYFSTTFGVGTSTLSLVEIKKSGDYDENKTG